MAGKDGIVKWGCFISVRLGRNEKAVDASTAFSYGLKKVMLPRRTGVRKGEWPVSTGFRRLRILSVS